MKKTSILSRLFEPRSFENPRVSIADAAAAKLWGINPVASGANVTTSTALTAAPVLACTNVISQDISSLPLSVFERGENGARRLAEEHPVQPLIHDRPNENLCTDVWRMTSQAHTVLKGNGYSRIHRDRAGRPGEIELLAPDSIRPEKLPSRVVYHQITGRALEAPEVLHIKGLGWNGLTGFSVVGLMREAIGLGMSAEEFGARFFGNGAQPSGVLSHPAALGQEAAERIGKDWERLHGGQNRQSVAVLEEGMQYTQVSISPDDAQFLETRRFQAEDIARAFRVPPHKIGILENATFSNIEQQGMDYVQNTLRTWIVRWEHELNAKLFPQDNAGRFYVKFNLAALLRGDISSRYSAYAVGRQWGWLSANDIRGFEDMNPIDGGDAYLVPMNMIQSEGRALELATAAARRQAIKEQKMITRQLERLEPAAFDTWLDGYCEKQARQIQENLCLTRDQADEAGRSMRLQLELNPESMRNYVNTRTENLARRSNANT